MEWIWAALAPALIAGVLYATGWAHPAILAYHVLCATAIVRARKRIRPLFAWHASTGKWAAGASVLFVGVLLLPLLVWDPRSIQATAAAALFPWKRADLGFMLFAAYTMLVHCPLEEIFWRGAVTKPDASMRLAITGNAVFFYLVHVGALAYTLGALGWLLAVPAGLAGGAWAFMTRRTGSIWPALISHWAVDAVILWGMGFCFVRG